MLKALLMFGVLGAAIFILLSTGVLQTLVIWVGLILVVIAGIAICLLFNPNPLLMFIGAIILFTLFLSWMFDWRDK